MCHPAKFLTTILYSAISISSQALGACQLMLLAAFPELTKPGEIFKELEIADQAIEACILNIDNAHSLPTNRRRDPAANVSMITSLNEVFFVIMPPVQHYLTMRD